MEMSDEDYKRMINMRISVINIMINKRWSLRGASALTAIRILQHTAQNRTIVTAMKILKEENRNWVKYDQVKSNRMKSR